MMTIWGKQINGYKYENCIDYTHTKIELNIQGCLWKSVDELLNCLSFGQHWFKGMYRFVNCLDLILVCFLYQQSFIP